MPLTEEKQKNFNEYLQSLQGTMPPEDYAAIQAVFSKNEQAMDKTAQGVMSQQDFSRRGLQLNQRLQEVDQQRNEVAQKLQEIARYEAKAVEWETYLQHNSVPRAEYEAAQNTIAQLRSYKEEVKSTLANMELDDLVKDPEEGTMPDNNNRAASNGSPSQQQQQQYQQQQQQNGGGPPARPGGAFATQETVQRMMVESVIGSTLGTAQLFQLNNEYRQLTGKELGTDPESPTLDALIVEAVKAGKPQMEYIRERLGFDKLRAAKNEADMEAKIQARVTAEVARIASESKLPFGSSSRAPSTSLTDVIFKEDTTKKGKPVQPGQFGEGSNRATQAYLSGKYRSDSGSSII